MFLRARAVPVGTAVARISYGDSVCLSGVSRPGTESSPGKILRFSPYDSLESLVSSEVIWCHWVKRFPSNEGIKRGTPTPLEIVILPLLAHLA